MFRSLDFKNKNKNNNKQKGDLSLNVWCAFFKKFIRWLDARQNEIPSAFLVGRGTGPIVKLWKLLPLTKQFSKWFQNPDSLHIVHVYRVIKSAEHCHSCTGNKFSMQHTKATSRVWIINIWELKVTSLVNHFLLSIARRWHHSNCQPHSAHTARRLPVPRGSRRAGRGSPRSRGGKAACSHRRG